MSLYDKASLIFSGAAGAGNKDVAYNIKPVEKLKVDEYVTNGDFSDGSTGWTLGNANVTISNGSAVFDGSAYTTLKWAGAFEAGKTYRVSVEATMRAGSFTVSDSTGGTPSNLIKTSGKHSFYIKATSSDLYFVSFNTPFDFTIDNVSVREVEQKANDFSFVRASDLTATYEGPDGLIKKTRENLLTYSNDFDNAIWSVSGTWTSGQSGYDGSTNAWSFNKADASGNDYYTQFFHGLHTFSIYAKKQSSAGLAIYAFYDWNGSSYDYNRRVMYNLDTGTELSNQSGIISTTCEAVGDTWWRITMTMDQDDMRWYLYTTDGTETLVDNVTVTLQDAQLERGLVATPYIHRTDSYSKSTAGIQEDEPRYDYSLDNALPPALLYEPERTNKFIHSEYLASSSIFKTNSSFTTNQGTSPEGLNNAAKMNEGTASGNLPHNFYYSGIQNSKTYTISFYAKKIDRDHVYVNIYSGVDSKFVFYDLSDGTVATSSLGDVTASISDAGSGWYRISYTRDTASTGSPNFRIGMSSANGTVDYQGNGSETLFYGVQWEEGSCVTSYIPTYGSAATRKTDTIPQYTPSKTNLDKYTFFAHSHSDRVVADNRAPRLKGDGNSALMGIFVNAAGKKQFFLYDNENNSKLSKATFGSFEAGDDTKYAFVVDNIALEAKLFVDGLLRETISLSGRVDAKQVSIGNSDGNPDRIKSIMYFPEALEDGDVVSLTT
jgi:hypothetical protein